jgi:hypothetical protein
MRSRLLSAAAERDRGDPDQRHRHCGEHEGGTDDRAERDPFRSLAPADDRDHRDDGFGECGADRSEDASHRTRAEADPVAKPLDGVGEQESTGEDDGEADEKEQNRHCTGLGE